MPSENAAASHPAFDYVERNVDVLTLETRTIRPKLEPVEPKVEAAEAAPKQMYGPCFRNDFQAFV